MHMVTGSRFGTGKILRLLYLPAVMEPSITLYYIVLYLGTYCGFYSHFISNSLQKSVFIEPA